MQLIPLQLIKPCYRALRIKKILPKLFTWQVLAQKINFHLFFESRASFLLSNRLEVFNIT